ncbi:hypothetical protein BWZ43_23685 [Heyndrickxia oleronia]|jgi:uncharacterized membrane protein YfhO|uniref:Uncharacterized protein n=1 Tax=Heyndrickxia oleronia TaxID=38875 RepID=A0A8E2I3Z6_9BACI|nr:hypothetical protein BWZ43_23685 [Heyndrickxia oleronia]
MGFYYILLLLIGVVFLIVGALNKNVSRSIKIVIFFVVFGILFIVTSLILLMPGSTEIISDLINS